MLRDAAPTDFEAISAVVSQAFGRRDEADLIERLRADGDVLFELVDANDSALRGHILYSPLAIEGQGRTLRAAALAPVSVQESLRKNGIGSALIRAGNARCAQLGLEAIIVLGHVPYYSRFGFSTALAQGLQSLYAGPHLMALELRQGALEAGGRLRYAKAFGG